jgi:hypothetical protein
VRIRGRRLRNIVLVSLYVAVTIFALVYQPHLAWKLTPEVEWVIFIWNPLTGKGHMWGFGPIEIVPGPSKGLDLRLSNPWLLKLFPMPIKFKPEGENNGPDISPELQELLNLRLPPTNYPRLPDPFRDPATNIENLTTWP